MRRAILCFLPVAACLSLLAATAEAELHAQDFAATWQGTLSAGAEQQRVVIQIAKKDSGGWTPTGCFVEFTHDDMHVDSMVVHGTDVKLTMNGGKAAYLNKVRYFGRRE